MKYLTPKRYLALGKLDEEQAFLHALQDWEDALAAYSVQVDRIKPQLPPDLPRLFQQVYLHDSLVLSMHRNGDDFVITLAPDTDPQRLVVLSYSLVEEPHIATDILPPDRCGSSFLWGYDEVDIDLPESPQTAETPTFRHNIFLTNGWEVILRFRNVSVVRPLRVIPVSAPKPAAIAS